MTRSIKIKNIKRKGRNFLLVLENNAEILLTAETITLFKLNKITEIDDVLLSEIILFSDMKRAENYLSYLLARRSYTIGLVKTKMAEKGYSPDVIKKTILNFVENGYLDDEKFAREMVSSLLRRKPAGRKYLFGVLRQKHVPRGIAEKVISEMMMDIDEVQLAEKLLSNRLRYFSKFDLETARTKAYNYLSRRAIGYRAAKIAFEKVFKEEDGH